MPGRALRSIIRRPARSLIMIVLVALIGALLMTGMSSANAVVTTQEATRQDIGAGFLLRLNDADRRRRLDEGYERLGESEGQWQGYRQTKLENGQWVVSTDHSFDTLLADDIATLAGVEGVSDYNVVTMATPVNPVDFARIEDADADQSADIGGVTLRGERNMALDTDVSSGAVRLVTGRWIEPDDDGVCVISRELAEANGLTVGDTISVNDYRDRQSATVVGASIVGVYERTEPATQTISGDTYRAENVIYTDLSLPERAEGHDGDPLYQYALLRVADVDEYETVRTRLRAAGIDWSRYDLVDRNGSSERLSGGFAGLARISGTLTAVTGVAGGAMLIVAMLFWLRGRYREIGVLISLGLGRVAVWLQLAAEAVVLAAVGFAVAMLAAPPLARVVAAWLVDAQGTAGTGTAASAGTVSVTIDAALAAGCGGAVAALVLASCIVVGLRLVRLTPSRLLAAR